MMSFGHLTEDELDAIVAYMDSLVGAPKWMAGKVLVNKHGCRGCHAIQGSGGDNAPSLEGIASKSAAELHLPGHEGSVRIGAWHAEHLRDPAAVVEGSLMPRPELNEEEIEQVTTYLLSLRERTLPLGVLPKAEAVARIQGDKDHASDGAALYGTYCAACHGAGAQGMVLDELETRVPTIGGHDFLAVASDEFLEKTLEVGRSGRNMPGWTGKDGGLDEEEVAAIIGYLRSMEPEPPTLDEVLAAPADVEVGRKIFAGTCASCHGVSADGTVVGPSLVNDEFLTIASDEFLYRTIVQGRPGTAMPSHRDLDAGEVRGLMAFLDSHRTKPKVDVSDYRARGSQSYGKTLYDAHCASCHERDGGGGIGPAIGNEYFLQAASDGFLAASIREGRGNRAMRAFGKGRGGIVDLHDREIDDIVTYMRSWQGQDRGVLKGRVQGSATNGAELYVGMCAGCHGTDGAGGLAPALNNQGFLDAASDGFLQATILKGRAGTAMRSWGNHGFAELTPQEVNDLTSYIRSWDKERPR
jgi:mono/diheme cytochrome c family protein